MTNIDPIEQFIRNAFDQNFEDIRRDSGHVISPHIKELALNQVLFYWKKLKEVAESITETEVKLNLPNQKTPSGRKFSIEGVVDIVRANDRVIMYDIKTHEADYVRAHPDEYERQLNVYAHIWHHLRGQQLDETAIIATAYPPAVREAIASRDPATIARALTSWDPLIGLPFKPENVQAMIADFARIVDEIEENHFSPTPVEKLRDRVGKSDNSLFATAICRYCDARFSCSAYRAYASTAKGYTIERSFKKYYNDLGPDPEREDWTTTTLNYTPDSATLADII
jgi:hypothetical protein